MHQERQQAIKLIMDTQGLTFDQASRAFEMQARVELVRVEAEQILGERLPAAFASRFIGAFCENAPEIGVHFLQSNLSHDSSPDDWRFTNDLSFQIGRDITREWFSVDVIPYGVSQRPVATLRVIDSPAQALAQFAKELLKHSGDLASSKGTPLNEDAVSNCATALARSIASLQCRVETRASQDAEVSTGYLNLPLGQALQNKRIVPCCVPTPQFVHDLCLAADLLVPADDFTRAYEPLKQRNHTHGLAFARQLSESLLRTLGEGQPIRIEASPRELFNNFKSGSREGLPGSKRQVAAAYLQMECDDSHSAQPHDAHQFIESTMKRLGELLENINRRRAQFDKVATPYSIRERDESSRVYLQYVRNAINENRDFLARLFSN